MNKIKNFHIEYLIKNIDVNKNYKNKIYDLVFAIFCFMTIVHFLSGPFLEIKTIELYPYIIGINLIISIFIFFNNLVYLKKEKEDINKEIKKIENTYNISKEILKDCIIKLENILKNKNINLDELKKEELEILFLNILQKDNLITNKS